MMSPQDLSYKCVCIRGFVHVCVHVCRQECSRVTGLGEALLGIQPPTQVAENGDVSFLARKFSSHEEAEGKGKIQA